MARQHEYLLHLTLLGEHPFEATLYSAPGAHPDRLLATEAFGPFDTLLEVHKWLLCEIKRDQHRPPS